jgi:hypothetical protein
MLPSCGMYMMIFLRIYKLNENKIVGKLNIALTTGMHKKVFDIFHSGMSLN